MRPQLLANQRQRVPVPTRPRRSGGFCGTRPLGTQHPRFAPFADARTARRARTGPRAPGASAGSRGPTVAAGSRAQMPAHLSEGRLKLPAQGEPRQDSFGIGAQRCRAGLGWRRCLADHHPSQGFRRLQSRVVPEHRLRGDLDGTAASPTVTASALRRTSRRPWWTSRPVLGSSTTTAAGLGRRLPLRRGRPTWSARRGGAGP